jgi:hypothetical protein
MMPFLRYGKNKSVERFLLDTGIAQDFINNRQGVRARVDAERHRGNRIGICAAVLGELWAGIEGSASRDRNLQRGTLLSLRAQCRFDSPIRNQPN